MDGLDRWMNTLTTVTVLTSLSLPQHTHCYSGSGIWHHIKRAESPDTADWIWKFTTRAANSVMTTSILSILVSSGLNCWSHDQLEVFTWGQYSYLTARLFILSYIVVVFFLIFSCFKQTKQKQWRNRVHISSHFHLRQMQIDQISPESHLHQFLISEIEITSAPLCFPLLGKFIS